MKGASMLIVSIRGENFGFWSHLRCPGQYAIIFSRKDLFCMRRRIKKYILSIRFKFSITSIPKEHCNKMSLSIVRVDIFLYWPLYNSVCRISGLL